MVKCQQKKKNKEERGKVKKDLPVFTFVKQISSQEKERETLFFTTIHTYLAVLSTILFNYN